MNVITRGIRNAFRNAIRTVAIIVILGLSIALSLVMLIAHHAVSDKISITLSSIGNTVNIRPANFFRGNVLTTGQLNAVARLPHVTGLDEALSGVVQPAGTTNQVIFPKGASVHANANPRYKAYTTSLRSPIKENCGGHTCPGVDGFNNTQQVGNGPGPRLPANFSAGVTFSGSTEPAEPADIQASTLRIVSGHVINGTADTSQAMVSTAMAAKNNLKTGSVFTAYGKTLTVAAVFATDTLAGSDSVIVSLPAMQRLSHQGGDVASATATVDSLANLAPATSAIGKTLGASADVTSNIAQASQALASLGNVKSISVYSLAGAVAAGAVIVLLIMIMTVRERKREIGILKAIGAPDTRIMAQFVTEALSLTVLGAAAGFAAGTLAGGPATSALVRGSGNPAASGSANPMVPSNPLLSNLGSVHAQADWGVIASGLAAAALIAIIGSAAASYFISKIQPAQVLRSE